MLNDQGKKFRKYFNKCNPAAHWVLAFINIFLVFSLILVFPILEETQIEETIQEKPSIVERNTLETTIDSSPLEHEKASYLSTIIKYTFVGLVIIAGVVTGYYVIKYAFFSDSAQNAVSSKIDKNEINFLVALRLLLALNGSLDASFTVPWDSSVIINFIQDLEAQANVNFRDLGKVKEILQLYYEFPVKADFSPDLCEAFYRTPKFQSIVRALIIHTEIQLNNLVITDDLKLYLDNREYPELLNPTIANYYLHTVVRF